jgi:hypothetical protein
LKKIRTYDILAFGTTIAFRDQTSEKHPEMEYRENGVLRFQGWDCRPPTVRPGQDGLVDGVGGRKLDHF